MSCLSSVIGAGFLVRFASPFVSEQNFYANAVHVSSIMTVMKDMRVIKKFSIQTGCPLSSASWLISTQNFHLIMYSLIQINQTGINFGVQVLITIRSRLINLQHLFETEGIVKVDKHDMFWLRSRKRPIELLFWLNISTFHCSTLIFLRYKCVLALEDSIFHQYYCLRNEPGFQSLVFHSIKL